MIIKELIDKYQRQGFFRDRAESLAAQEIIIKKIVASPLRTKIHLKTDEITIVSFLYIKNILTATKGYL